MMGIHCIFFFKKKQEMLEMVQNTQRRIVQLFIPNWKACLQTRHYAHSGNETIRCRRTYQTTISSSRRTFRIFAIVTICSIFHYLFQRNSFNWDYSPTPFLGSLSLEMLIWRSKHSILPFLSGRCW